MSKVRNGRLLFLITHNLRIMVVRFVQLLKTHGLTPLSDAFFNADHDELTEIYMFSKKNLPPPPTFVFIK